jgi:hypothetical protein
MTFVTLPRCKAENGHGREWCGRTCNCGFSDYKRHLAIQTVRAQVRSVRERWGEDAITEATR